LQPYLETLISKATSHSSFFMLQEVRLERADREQLSLRSDRGNNENKGGFAVFRSGIDLPLCVKF
jgi:hypothetical protein